MKQIRTGVFETNSSSVHSICISKHRATLDKSITFMIGEYGWENDAVNVPDYLYTAILLQDDHDRLLSQLKRMLDRMNIDYKFQTPQWSIYHDGQYLENGNIDHCGDTREFIDAVLSDDNMLMRALFNPDSIVYTGNDNNGDEKGNGCYVAEETIWDYDAQTYVPNPYHDAENYDYFIKTN